LENYQELILEDETYLSVFKLLAQNGGRATLKELAEKGDKTTYHMRLAMAPLVDVDLIYHVPEDRLYWLSGAGEIARDKIERGELELKV